MTAICKDMKEENLVLGDQVKVFDKEENLICVGKMIGYVTQPILNGDGSREYDQIEVEWTDEEGTKIAYPSTKRVWKIK